MTVIFLLSAMYAQAGVVMIGRVPMITPPPRHSAFPENSRRPASAEVASQPAPEAPKEAAAGGPTICDREPGSAECLYVRSKSKRLRQASEDLRFQQILTALAEAKFGPGQYKLDGPFAIGEREICKGVAFDIRPILNCELRADR